MMQEFIDSFKHLRSIHLVFVLASAAITMALSSSDSIYETAVEQLLDVLRLTDDLTAESIASSTYETAEVSKSKNKLKGFIEESMVEYAEEMDVYFNSLEIQSFIVDMSRNELFGHSPSMDLYERYRRHARDEKYWFGQGLCLLGDGTKLYTHPDDLHLLRAAEHRTLGDYSSFLNRLLQVNSLYVAPTFHSRYFREGPVSERYEVIPDDVLKRLSEMKDIGLSIKLMEVGLTERASRGVFKTSQEHAKEDPGAYTYYDFKFDTLTLEVTARSRATSQGDDRRNSLKFKFVLPVMFLLREPKFMADALQQAPSDKAYYARYISGARSFDELFPELAKTSTHLRSVKPKDLELYLEEQSQTRGVPVSLLGLQIRRDLIEVWGVLLMLCVQLYFCMHYRALINRIPQIREILFPWIGLYRDYVSTIVFQISIALPFCVCLFVAFGPDQQSRFHLLEIGWLLIALGLLCWTEAIYVRSRRLSS